MHTLSAENVVRFLIMMAMLLRGACASGIEPLAGQWATGGDIHIYGVVYPSLHGEWTEDERLALRSDLEWLSDHGVKTVIQDFSGDLLGTDREKDWLIFLDEAYRADVQVVAFPYFPERLDSDGFDTSGIRGFLDVVGDHPALVGLLGLHEPLERYTITQLQDYYAQVKSYAPELPVGHLMGDMAGFAVHPGYPDRELAPGVCDICVTWQYPARDTDEVPVFQAERYRLRLKANRDLVDRQSAGSQLWVLGQSFAYEDVISYRMPTPDEMMQLFQIAAAVRIDGLFWYPWHHNLYAQVLADEEMSAQRSAVSEIYECYVAPNLPP